MLNFFYKFRLGGGGYMGDRGPVELPGLCQTVGTQPTADQQLENGIPDMSQPQHSDITDLLGRHGKLKIIMQRQYLQARMDEK